MTEVAVIGAGCAGLSAATALAAAGCRVALVEARPMCGGRTFATRDRVTGDWVDNGQHALFGCYHETLDYLTRIGTSGATRVQSALAAPMVRPDGHATELRCPALPSPLHLAAGVLAWDALPWRERLAVRHLAPALAPHAPAPPPAETVREWLVRHRQPAGLVDLLWEPLAVAALNQSIDQATAGTFVEVIRRMLGGGPDDAAIVLPVVSLSELLVDPALALLARAGADVHCGAPARLLVTDGGVDGVRVRDRRIQARVVVSAVPWHALAALFDEVPAPVRDVVRDASAMGSAPIATVNLWFDRDVIETPFLGLPGRRFQWVFDKARLAAGGARHLSLVCSGAEEVVGLTNDAMIDLARTELAAAVPAAARARLQRATAVRERRATFSLAAGQPSRPGTHTGLPGLLLAGDWTDTGLPATIEGAVASGHRAAAAALAVLRGREHGRAGASDRTAGTGPGPAQER
ncbi:MAG: hydroxysqualene dehydroxylase HpnE [Vicinamibacterales bacterium]